MEEQVLGKRTSLACEPCRRKKVKCSGERPKCAFCSRLGQSCDYRSEEPGVAQSSWLNNRMDEIVGKLDKLLSFNGRADADTIARERGSTSTEPSSSRGVDARVTDTSLPSSNQPLVVPLEMDHKQIGETYQTWCHNQPLYLFRQSGFLESLEHRDTEVRLAIQVLSSRFPPGILEADTQKSLDDMVQNCRRLVIDRMASGDVRLSTLQTLCLLSLISFRDGKSMQAGLDLAMARYFANGLPHGSSLGDALEYSLCVQAIKLLHYIQERVGEVSKAGQLGLLKNTTSIQIQPSRFTLLGEPGLDPDPGSEILPFAEQAAEVWHMARIYAASPVGSDETPPWDPRSDYSHIVLRLLELDTVFPLKYRFVRSNFSTTSLESLQKRRDYWGPWFFIQFIHHAVPCLLNHPFLLSMRLKNYKRLTPQTFIHQSFDQLARHTAWIICFIDLIQKQEFLLSDPIIAHCVTIVATIHLQHSFVVNDSLRERAQTGYNKCTKFLERMSVMWPVASSMAQNLKNLHDSVNMVTPVTHSQSAPDIGGSWSIDAHLLWNILIYEKACQHNANADRSMYGEAIVSQAQHREQDVTDYAIIGSAGISGHKTVLREVSAYAPEVDEGHPWLNNSQVTPVFMGEETGLSHGHDYRNLHIPGQIMDDQNVLLQAEDFHNAFVSWLESGIN